LIPRLVEEVPTDRGLECHSPVIAEHPDRVEILVIVVPPPALVELLPADDQRQTRRRKVGQPDVRLSSARAPGFLIDGARVLREIVLVLAQGLGVCKKGVEFGQEADDSEQSRDIFAIDR